MFKNREEAAFVLAKELIKYKGTEAVVVSIPRGGVPIGMQLAKELKLPLEVVLSKKIGHPLNKEFAIGAVTLDGVVLNDIAQDISEEYIKNEIARIRDLLKQRQEAFYGNVKPLSLSGKTVILVDDGAATGSTLLSCVSLLQKQLPKKIVVAIPVAPPSVCKKIEQSKLVDSLICVLKPYNFSAVGQFYSNFNQVSNEAVIAMLKSFREIHYK
jgi:predicted phosphoribosyltransferase